MACSRSSDEKGIWQVSWGERHIMVRVCALRTNHPSTFFLMPNWMERTKSPNWWWQSLVSREKALVRRYATSDEFPSKSCEWLRTKLSFRFQKQLLSNLPLHSEFSWFTSRLRAAAAEFDELLVSLPILHIYQQVNCIFPTHTFILLTMEMLMLHGACLVCQAWIRVVYCLPDDGGQWEP